MVRFVYLFHLFRSFLPLRNTIGFGISDFVELAFAMLLTGLLVFRAWVLPFAYRLARRPLACMLVLFALAVLLRIALLRTSPIPLPSGADDFSYVLLGDTLRHFRMANPTHPEHRFFETLFVLQEPTYSSIYPLAQGVALAFGRILFGNFWWGVLFFSGALAALCYWMLRAWIPPGWALLGGLFTIAEFGPLSQWTNTYWGGTVSACAGCLVFGSLARLKKGGGHRYGWLLGAGLGAEILARPFEAVLLALCTVPFLWRAKPNLRPLGAALIGVLAACGLTLVQNKAVTRSWMTLPYMLSRDEYGVPTTFTFQQNPVPHRPLTPDQELDYRAQSAIHGPGTDSIQSYFARLGFRFRYLRFFLMAPLFLVLPLARARGTVWALGAIALFTAGANFYPFFYPHYIAAVSCLFILIAIAGIRRLSGFKRLRQAAVWLTLLCFAQFLFWYSIYLSDNEALLEATRHEAWDFVNFGDPEGRTSIQSRLDRMPGQKLVFVRYSGGHRFQEWVQNAADIDGASVVWANDLGADDNQELLRYYPKRQAWLLQPDLRPPSLTPYSQ